MMVLAPATVLAAALTTAALFALMVGGDGRSRPPVLRALGFALLGGITAALLVSARAGGAPSREAVGSAFREYTEAVLEAKRAYVPILLQPGQDATAVRERAIRRFRAALAAAPDSVRFRRELAILLEEQGRRQEALREFDRAVAALRRRGQTARAAEEAALWPRVYGEPPPRPSDIPALRARIEALQLGWFRYLALAALYERAGQSRPAQELRRAAADEALAQHLLLAALGTVLFLLGGVGVFLTMLFIRQAARRVWRPVGGEFAGSASLLGETFILFMFLNAALGLVRNVIPGLPRAAGASSERAIASVIAAVLVGDLLSLTPLLYLAFGLRRCGQTLAAIGLTWGDGFREVGRGIAVYIATLPWLFVVAGLTAWLGERVFPNVAPPFHPVQALTVAASSGWARLGLFLIVAVGAPIIEETFFRGVLYGALRRRFGVVVGIVGSAAFFALLHPQLPLGFVPIFFLGVVLAGLYEWRRSLLPGMALHAVNNGLLFLFLTLLFPPSD